MTISGDFNNFRCLDICTFRHLNNFRWNCFEKTGCLITADGTEDGKIKPEGLPNYKVVPSLPMPGPEEQVEEENPEPAPEPEDTIEEEDLFNPSQSENEDEEASPSERIDSVEDHSFTEPLVGRKIRGLYEDGWHVGTLDYFNTKFEEYHIQFLDSSEDDYIKSTDIDGVEMILFADHM